MFTRRPSAHRAGPTDPGSGPFTGGDEALVITADDELAAVVSGLAAATGAPARVVADPNHAMRHWQGAGLVLVGSDLAASVASLSPPPHRHVAVVTTRVEPEDFRLALAVGASEVAEATSSTSPAAALLRDLADGRSQRGQVIGVLAGSGGVGASILVCGLAQVSPAPVAVVDLDPLGPGVDRILGIEEDHGVRWSDLDLEVGQPHAATLRDALPKRGLISVLSFGDAPHGVGSSAGLVGAGAISGATSGSEGLLSDPAQGAVEVRDSGLPVMPSPATLRAVIDALARRHDRVLIDLPRATGAAWDEAVLRCDVVVVMVHASVAGVASAARAIAALPDPNRVRLVVRSGGVPAAAVGHALGVRVLGAVSAYSGVGEAVDLGYGPVRSPRSRLGRALRSILAGVDEAAR